LGYEVINLGGGRAPTTINEVIAGIEQRLGKKAKCRYMPFHKADISETRADISKAGRLLGWTPEVDLEEGITRTVDWYVANRSWVKDVAL
jgi:nucleoside-diphosphate-sugar epimerase